MIRRWIAITVAGWSLITSAHAAITYSNAVSQDAWDYDHAPSPGGDDYLRSFGDGTVDSRMSTGDLKFNLSSTFSSNTSYQLVSAQLTIWETASSTPPTAATALPLVVRNLSPYLADGGTLWNENNFDASQHPALDFSSSLGTGNMSNAVAGQVFAITFQLDVSKIDFNSAVNLGVLSLGLQTDQPAAQPPSPSLYYKYFSLNGAQDIVGASGYAPTLQLEVQAIPEPSAGALVALGMLGLAFRFWRKKR